MNEVKDLKSAVNAMIKLKGKEVLISQKIALSLMCDVAPKLKKEKLQFGFLYEVNMMESFLQEPLPSKSEQQRIYNVGKNRLIKQIGLEEVEALNLLNLVGTAIGWGPFILPKEEKKKAIPPEKIVEKQKIERHDGTIYAKENNTTTKDGNVVELTVGTDNPVVEQTIEQIKPVVKTQNLEVFWVVTLIVSIGIGYLIGAYGPILLVQYPIAGLDMSMLNNSLYKAIGGSLLFTIWYNFKSQNHLYACSFLLAVCGAIAIFPIIELVIWLFSGIVAVITGIFNGAMNIIDFIWSGRWVILIIAIFIIISIGS